jgi:uncharacterized protein (TIGR02246 family)
MPSGISVCGGGTIDAMRHCIRIALRGYTTAAATILAVLAYAPEGWSKTPRPARCEEMTKEKAAALFDEWNKALQVKPADPTGVALTYTLDGVLLPTFKSGPLVGRNNIRGYFVTFLKENPVGRLDSQDLVPAGCNIGVVAGLYTFTVDEETRRVDKPARYTFVYVYKREGTRERWLIAHQHSSARPPKGAAD